MKTALVIIWPLLAGTVFLACTGSKFSSAKRADLRAFSSQTTALLGEFNPALTELGLIRLRDLVDPEAPEETLLRELTARSRKGRVFMIDFSLRMASMPRGSQRERVAYFADLIDEVADFMQARGTLPENVRGVRAAVRKQSDVIGASAASIPLIQAGMDAGIANLSRIDDTLEALVKKLEHKIDERHAATLSRAQKLKSVREELLNAAEYVGMARRGDEGAMARLLEDKAVALAGGIPEGDDGLQQLMVLLVEQVDWIDRVKNLIKDDLEAYIEDHAELDRVHLEMRRRLNLSRVHLITWMLGYSRMASGVVAPAEWFDLRRTPALLLNQLGVLN